MAASILLSSPTRTSTLPPSIRLAFERAHPSASSLQFRFSENDAGIFFLVEFEEAGSRKSDLYRYTSRDWLLDEQDTLAVDREEDTFGTDEGAKSLALTRF